MTVFIASPSEKRPDKGSRTSVEQLSQLFRGHIQAAKSKRFFIAIISMGGLGPVAGINYRRTGAIELDSSIW